MNCTSCTIFGICYTRCHLKNFQNYLELTVGRIITLSQVGCAIQPRFILTFGRLHAGWTKRRDCRIIACPVDIYTILIVALIVRNVDIVQIRVDIAIVQALNVPWVLG